jgi:hypothetical protein
VLAERPPLGAGTSKSPFVKGGGRRPGDFSNPSESGRLEAIFERLKGSHVLTVGDTLGFAKTGGMINFVIKNERVSFEVNLEAVRRTALDISYKLLKHASSIVS